MRKIFIAVAAVSALVIGANQLAAEEPAKEASPKVEVKERAFKASTPEHAQKMRMRMSEEERQKFFAEREEKWKAMTKEEKVKFLNEQHAQRIKATQDRWAGLNDDQKIKQYENRIKYAKKGRERMMKMREAAKKCGFGSPQNNMPHSM